MFGGWCGWHLPWLGGFGGAGMGFFGMFFGLLLFVGLIAGVIALVAWAVRGPLTTQTPAPSRPPARQVLDERYARGEITREEYLAMLQDLAGGGRQ